MHLVQAKGILSAHNVINVYRGCTHGCIYCDSRSLCYHTPVPFEDVEAKENAPQLLEAALRSKRKRCMIGTGAMCDPYLHAEKELQLTRRCLEVICRNGFGAAVLTKSDMVLRDIDLLEQINRDSKAVVQMTLTTLDDDLCRIIEPNVCPTSRRFEVLCELRERGIPTVVWLTAAAVHQRYRGERPWDTGAGSPSGLQGRDGVRNGADPARRQPRILLRGA